MRSNSRRTKSTSAAVSSRSSTREPISIVRLTVRAGERRTGGHSIRVARITRDGPTLTLRCEISTPRDGAMLTQALTYPAQTVSVDDGLVRGVRVVVLVDQSGEERVRITA